MSLDGTLQHPSFERLFQDRMQRPDVVAAYFFPLGYARWDRDYYILPKTQIGAVRSSISGVRLQQVEADESAAKQCQQDVMNLVRSLMQLRATPGMETMVLSGQAVISPQLGSSTNKRVKFGLCLDPQCGTRHEARAARQCHRRLVQAINKAGFVINAPLTFKPKTGFDGLLRWAETLQLSFRRSRWPWFVLLLPGLAAVVYFWETVMAILLTLL
ncbi:MAG: hypothetical protein V2J55_11345 [Candidatus Competibacteraceae bacterium]|jgi:hypothetical protein|nr:hypothetical protein [Candidatus Competibacteraceae bacterium]